MQPVTVTSLRRGSEMSKSRMEAIRSCLSRRLDWRVTPQVHFVLDDTVDDAIRISAALDDEARALHELNPEGIDGIEDAYKGEAK